MAQSASVQFKKVGRLVKCDRPEKRRNQADYEKMGEQEVEEEQQHS